MTETKAHYVVERDMATNTIVVAEENNPALYHKEINVTNVNWIMGEAPQMPLQCLARIRYRQPLQAACIRQHVSGKNNSMLPTTCYIIRFDEPQRAVAPGQSAVFYAEDGAMLGGGIIA